MDSQSTLRSLLRTLDGTAISIQKTAASMMKQYAQAQVAVTEWRNALHSCQRNDQLLSLLYVANETIQTSKRNRGNKFLEAFSPVLGQSLVFICQRDGNITEKVRRTVKVWGDRQIFSQRFVGELLHGLDVYRNNNHSNAPKAPQLREPRFSPEVMPEDNDAAANVATDLPEPAPQTKDEDILEILESTGGGDDDGDEDDDDDDDMFQDNSESQKLKIDLDLDATVQKGKTAAKRRRSGTGANAADGSNKRSRRGILSASNLLEVWNRLTGLESTFDHAKVTLAKIDGANQKTSRAELESSVGDELDSHYRQMHTYQSQIVSQRESLHAIAQQRHSLENLARRYIPWLEHALQQDDQDLVMCDQLEAKLASFATVHTACRKARDAQRAEDERMQAQKELQARKKKEEEEERKFRQASLAKETEAKPGMRWNPVTREYQAINTNEDWRDH